ncbi:MAG: hypothetical protein RLY21_728 [Planctomycetota bacterium]|jgi:hypothetical protein
MGWYFRRSIGLGPFRLNLSKSGLGWSVGGRGFRTGVDARGRRTTHASIPGTGIGYRKTGARGCLLVFGAALLLAGGALGIGIALGAAV